MAMPMRWWRIFSRALKTPDDTDPIPQGTGITAERVDHPRLKRRPTLAQFCALEHVIVSPDGGGFFAPTDAALAEQGLNRQVGPVGR